jgi:hypothetical protein
MVLMVCSCCLKEHARCANLGATRSISPCTHLEKAIELPGTGYLSTCSRTLTDFRRWVVFL